jgi:hypothetical protein
MQNSPQTSPAVITLGLDLLHLLAPACNNRVAKFYIINAFSIQ